MSWCTGGGEVGEKWALSPPSHPGDSTVLQSAPHLLTADLASPDYLQVFSVIPWHQIGPFFAMAFSPSSFGGPSCTQCLPSFCKHFSNKPDSVPLLMADSEALLTAMHQPQHESHCALWRLLYVGPNYLAYKWRKCLQNYLTVLEP